MKNIDIKKVIERLKRELNIKHDKELADKLGISKTYLGAMKSRGEFTGSGWDAILKLCAKNDIDVNFAVFGKRCPGSSTDHLVTNLIRRLVTDRESADELVGQVEEAKARYADQLPKEAYRQELIRFAQKLLEAAL